MAVGSGSLESLRELNRLRVDDEPRTVRIPAQGRPPVLLRLDPSAGIAVGIDFDHTHVRIAVSDLSRTLVAEESIETDVDHDAPAALDLAAELVRTALDESGVDSDRVLGVGVAVAGPVDLAHGRLHD